MLVKERRKRGKSPPILIHISISALIEDRPWYWVLELSLYLIGTINYDVDKCALLDARFLDILGADWLCKVTWYFVAHQSINLNSSSSILIMCVMLYLTKILKNTHTHLFCSIWVKFYRITIKNCVWLGKRKFDNFSYFNWVKFIVNTWCLRKYM